MPPQHNVVGPNHGHELGQIMLGVTNLAIRFV